MQRLYRATDVPWKVFNEFRRILTIPIVIPYFLCSGIIWNTSWKIFGLPLIQRHRNSQIIIGKYMEMRNWQSTNPLAPYHRSIICTWSRTARLYIGDNVGMTGATICASSEIHIGNNVLLGANCTIADTDFHPLSPTERLVNPTGGISEPISISDNVFIGMNAIILKGVSIGNGSVVGAGSVVTRDVPAGVLVAGNPARIIRSISEDAQY